jgi:SAM-dependent methyltransferase
MDLANHYRDLFLKYGDTPEASQWRDRSTQEKRFEILCEIGNLEGASILDLGCGTGHLASYLKQKGLTFEYTGIDLVPEVLDAGRLKHPDYQFITPIELDENAVFDYVLISGTFNNLIEDNRTFYQEKLKQYFNHTRIGLAVNMLSQYVDYFDDGLFYEYPETVFKFAKTHLSQRVSLRNEYQLKPGILPFEFTTYIYR